MTLRMSSASRYRSSRRRCRGRPSRPIESIGSLHHLPRRGARRSAQGSMLGDSVILRGGTTRQRSRATGGRMARGLRGWILTSMLERYHGVFLFLVMKNNLNDLLELLLCIRMFLRIQIGNCQLLYSSKNNTIIIFTINKIVLNILLQSEHLLQRKYILL
jgi:hypothetical protein